MPQLVRQGVHAVSLVLIVQQDKWTRRISTPAICSTTFPRRLVNIDPSLFKRPTEDFTIVLTQRRKRSQYDLTRILVTYVISRLFHNRHIKIVHMQLIELQQALAQLHITIEQVNMLTDRLNQVVIDADRDIVLRKRPFAARSISTLPRVKDIPLHLGSEYRCNRVALLEERRVHTLKSFFTHAAIGAARIEQVVAFRQENLFALLIVNQRKLQVGVLNHRENGIRHAGNLFRCSQYRLHLGRTHMRSFAIQIMQLLPIEIQSSSLLHNLSSVVSGNARISGSM